MDTLHRLTAFTCVLFCLFVVRHSAFSQGGLTPPGTPAPTMKTLDQIEPRTPISSLPFSISTRGSYYLTGNLTATLTGHGIIINADGVTVDLAGFELNGANVGVDCIQIATHSGVTIRNGTIRNWTGAGVLCVGNSPEGRFEDLRVFDVGSAAIAMSDRGVAERCVVRGTAPGGITGLKSCRVIACTVSGVTLPGGISLGSEALVRDSTSSNNSAVGIVVGENSVLRGCSSSNNNAGYSVGENSVAQDCVAASNAQSGITAGNSAVLASCVAKGNGGNGISVGFGSSVTNCVARENGGPYGIQAASRSTITHCTAVANTSATAQSYGIFGTGEVTVGHCTSSSNTNTNASPTGSTGGGIYAGNSSSVKSCTVTGNKGDGIVVTADSQVIGNNCDSNGSGDGAGIHATSSDNRIEGNNVTDSPRGIDVDVAGNFITRNSASGNTLNWDVAASNVILVISATAAGAVSGNSGGTAPGSTDPNVNITY